MSNPNNGQNGSRRYDYTYDQDYDYDNNAYQGDYHQPQNPFETQRHSSSSDRLASLQQLHPREPSPSRHTGYEEYGNNAMGAQERLSYHPEDDSDPLYNTQMSYGAPHQPVSRPAYIPQQFSPIQDHAQLPAINVNDYSTMQQPHLFNEDEFYNHDTLTVSSFNAFPTENRSDECLTGPPPPPPPPPLPPLVQDTQYYGHQEPLAAPMPPYQENYELQDRFQSQEDEIGMDHYVGAEDYDINLAIPQNYDDDYSYDENDSNMEPPEHQRRRIEVGLLNGNLILDCPVPDKILEKYKGKTNVDDSRELKFMRYQAATCDPKDFVTNNFSLRQRYYKRPRDCEIMIVVTIYNEEDVLLARTLKGIFENIKHLESRKNSSTWGPESWKKVVVVIVADGRSKINETSQALLAGLGVYQEGFARSKVNEDPVVSHIYEYSSMIGISSIEKDTVKLTSAPIPTQLVFCLKEENKKKINSHRWALQAFGEVLQPKVVVLLDAGTQPSKDSIYHLWKEFDKDPNCAGTCGEIKAMLGPNFNKLLNPLVAAQNFEYKMSNILDKPMESSFGFISVLPGAFSAYRYQALLNSPNGTGPLSKYFEGETMHDQGAGVFKANMYLAEDRILCFELVAKRNDKWVLSYCRSASAETDVPEEVHDFVSQRRRWLNGSFFAAIYSVVCFHKLLTESNHSLGRKIALCVEFVYQLVALLVSWFSLASYFLVFRILTTGLGELYTPCKYLSVVFLWLYLLCMVTTFVLSFGNTPRGTPKFYLVIMVFFAILMAYMLAAAIVMAVKAVEEIFSAGDVTAKKLLDNSVFRDLIVSTASTYALYFIASFLHLKPMHMFTSFLQYLLLSPSYVNVLNIYAFCNLHDISWGTKGATAMTLGDAKITQDGKVEFVDAPITNEEINNSYEMQMDILAHLPKAKPKMTPEMEEAERQREKEKEKEKNDETQKDYYAFIRSMVVLTWITTNFIIIALVLETGGINELSGTTDNDADTLSSRSDVFLTVILWIVAFMAAFRLCGTVYYLIKRMIT